MRWFKYVALLAVLAVPAIYAQAQIAIGVQIGPDYGYYNAPPVCAYGYYPYYPFGCAPYGYWGPDYFVDGVFIGAGPWDHFYYRHPEIYERYGLFHRFHDRDDFRGGRFRDRDDFRRDRDFHGGEAVRVERFRDRGDFHGNRGFRGNESFRGGRDGGGHERAESHGNGGFRGGESHGGGEHHGGDHGGRR